MRASNALIDTNARVDATTTTTSMIHYRQMRSASIFSRIRDRLLPANENRIYIMVSALRWYFALNEILIFENAKCRNTAVLSVCGRL